MAFKRDLVLSSELKTPFFVPSPANWRADARSGGQKRRSRDWSHAQDAKHLSMAKPNLLTGVSTAARWSGEGVSLPWSDFLLQKSDCIVA
jgi:hypothetical protein